MNKPDVEYIFKKHLSACCFLAISIIKKQDLARQIVYNAFLCLLKQGDISDEEASVLFIKKEIIRNCLRKLERTKIINHDKDLVYFDENEIETSDVKSCDIKSKIVDILHTVSPTSNVVFSLSRFAGANSNEISSLMDISERSVEKCLSEVLVELSKKLKPVYKNVFVREDS